ncbi:LysR family transcriptional regulator [Bradyrhizobium sp. 14AA]
MLPPAPPPLSQQIKALEQELDVQLFLRKARGVELTDAGRAFLEEARATLMHLGRAFDSTRRASRGEQGRCASGSLLRRPFIRSCRAPFAHFARHARWWL